MLGLRRKHLRLAHVTSSARAAVWVQRVLVLHSVYAQRRAQRPLMKSRLRSHAFPFLALLAAIAASAFFAIAVRSTASQSDGARSALDGNVMGMC